MKATSARLLGVIAGLELCACNTGLVSIGDDRTLECEPDACGEMPSDSPLCSDMSMGRHVCSRDMDAACGWFLLCPSDPCPASACGAPPATAPMCFDGVWGSGWACEPAEMDCRWQGICPEQARQCPPDECGMPSGPIAECMAGVMQGLACLKAESDDCHWTSIVCALPP